MRRSTSPPPVPFTNCEPRQAALSPTSLTSRNERRNSVFRNVSVGSTLGLGDLAEDLNEPFRDNPVFAFLQLPHSKTESVRVARRTMTLLEVFTRRGFWISSTHATGPGARAAYA